MSNDRLKLVLKSVLGVCAALAVLLHVAGCNTVEGAGEDIEDAGEGIQEAAD